MRPLRVGDRTLARRSGLLVVVEDGEGHAGIGETAPLPGLHLESVEEAAGAAARTRGRAGRRGASPKGAPRSTAPSKAGSAAGLLPVGPHRHRGRRADAARRSRRDGPPAPARDRPRPRGCGSTDCSTGTPRAVLAGAARLVRSGYTALKIKVGRRDAARGGGARAGGAGARRAGGRAAPRRQPRLGPARRPWISRRAWRPPASTYLEEPLRDPGDLAAFAASSPVPVALDETLLDFSPQAPPPLQGVAALILKPAVLGGYERSLAWARLARRERLAAVVSAAFPSAVGLALDAAFAAALGDDTAHGLGTAAAFAEDLGRAPLRDRRRAASTRADSPSGPRISTWRGPVSCAERTRRPARFPLEIRAARTPDAPALVCRGTLCRGPRRPRSLGRRCRRTSFRELDLITAAVAQDLRARGVPPGERVGLLPRRPAPPTRCCCSRCCAPAPSRCRSAPGSRQRRCPDCSSASAAGG